MTMTNLSELISKSKRTEKSFKFSHFLTNRGEWEKSYTYSNDSHSVIKLDTLNKDSDFDYYLCICGSCSDLKRAYK